MGAWPDPGFPACPSTGPAKTAQAVGGGEEFGIPGSAPFPYLIPGRGKCRVLYPQDNQGELIPVPGPLFPVLCPAHAGRKWALFPCAPQREGSGLQRGAGVSVTWLLTPALRWSGGAQSKACLGKKLGSPASPPEILI